MSEETIVRCMATDELSDNGMGFDMPLSEFAKNLKPEKPNPNNPLLVYHKEPEWEWLKRIPKTTIRPNPNAINELISELTSKNQLIDLYSEKRQRENGETPTVDREAAEAMAQSELINLFEEKRLETLKKQGRR